MNQPVNPATPKFRTSLSLSEVTLLLSYLEKDAENILSNIALIKQFQKLKKKIQAGLLDPAYLAAGANQPSQTSPAVQAALETHFAAIRERVNAGDLTLTHEEENNFITYLTETLQEGPQTAAEQQLFNIVMTRKIFS